MQFCIFDYIFSLFWTSCGSLKPQFQNKHTLSALLDLDLKVINHLCSEVWGLQWPQMFKKNVIFVFLSPFLLYFVSFWPPWYPKAWILEPIWIICIAWARSQGYKPFSEVSVFPVISYAEENVILCFWPQFFSFLACFGILWPPEAPISGQIWIICITWVRIEGYKLFSEVSGLQLPRILKKLWFWVFDPILTLFWSHMGP